MPALAADVVETPPGADRELAARSETGEASSYEGMKSTSSRCLGLVSSFVESSNGRALTNWVIWITSCTSIQTHSMDDENDFSSENSSSDGEEGASGSLGVGPACR